MSLKSQAIHGLSWSLADKLINQLGSLAVTIYLARLIGPESFGFIGMLMIFMILLLSTDMEEESLIEKVNWHSPMLCF